MATFLPWSFHSTPHLFSYGSCASSKTCYLADPLPHTRPVVLQSLHPTPSCRPSVTCSTCYPTQDLFSYRPLSSHKIFYHSTHECYLAGHPTQTRTVAIEVLKVKQDLNTCRLSTSLMNCHCVTASRHTQSVVLLAMQTARDES